MSPEVLVATDLDRTLLYSRAAIRAHGDEQGRFVAVERYDGHDASWMAADAAAVFAGLHRDALVVPATTRTPEQWRRIRLPGPPPRYAVAANGGILLVDGVADTAWQHSVERELDRAAPLAEIWAHAASVCRPEWTVTLRNAHGLFCYAVLERTRLPAGFVAGAVADSAAWAHARGWQVSLQGRKLYWVPGSLSKSAAVGEIARRAGTSTLLAAGDSLLDADLLDAADAGIAARHGELAASGRQASHVTVTARCGVAAGTEIVDWFRAELDRLRPAG